MSPCAMVEMAVFYNPPERDLFGNYPSNNVVPNKRTISEISYTLNPLLVND